MYQFMFFSFTNYWILSRFDIWFWHNDVLLIAVFCKHLWDINFVVILEEEICRYVATYLLPTLFCLYHSHRNTHSSWVDHLSVQKHLLLDSFLVVHCRNILPLSQKKSHSGIQNLSQKISHLTLFRKCMCMQESISAKYG